MKQLLLIVGLFTTITSFSQINHSSIKISDRELGLAYLKKARQLRITGFSLLGGGIGIVASVSSGHLGFSTTGTLAILGGVLAVSSVPCFIAAGKNKGKAKILLRNENISLSFKSKKQYPAFGLAINL